MLRASRIAACLGAAAALACAGGPRVDFDAAHDWSRAASWDWLVRSPDVPRLGDEALSVQLAGALARELSARGLAHSPRPDLRVACGVALAREQVLRTELPASSFLPSLHGGSPSYEISASQRRWLSYETAALVVEIFDARTQRKLWSGRLERRVRGSFAEHADEAVAELLASFPPPAPRLLSASRAPASAAADPGRLP